MNSGRKVALLEKAFGQGATVMVGGPDGGYMTISSVDDLVAWADDETSYWMRAFGASHEQLAYWYDKGGGGGYYPGPRCIATTRKGHRCKNTVMGHSTSGDFADFVQLERFGGYCTVHEGFGR